MRAEELLREGKLLEARAELQEQVRANPDNAKYRVFLFQLLVVLGEWDRALTQLNVSGDLDAGTLAMVHMYREALQCEALRGEIFAGRRAPLVFGDPEPWVALLIEALRLTAEGSYAEARQLREQAFEAAPATPGTIDEQQFQWIADSDGRLGPVLEAIVSGRYYWVPFHRIREIHIEEPADLRDISRGPTVETRSA
jgi:type VI secretion system protein ImpE